MVLGANLWRKRTKKTFTTIALTLATLTAITTAAHAQISSDVSFGIGSGYPIPTSPLRPRVSRA